MGLFSFNKPVKHIELICDIGSGSVAVAFVEFLKGSVSNVLFSERIALSALRTDSSEGMHSALSKEFQEVLSQALDHAVAKGIKPAHISCFYSSPWFVAQTHVLKLKQKEPFVFSEEVLKKMIDDGERQFVSGSENPLSSQDVNLIERRITRIKLNGYETHKPFGKEASSAEISVFLAGISKETMKNVEDCISRMWRGVQIEHHTTALAAFAVIRSFYNTYSSFAVLHISSGVTDVSLISDGCLADTVSFPIGKKTIIKRIEETCGMDHELASSALSLYVKDHAHEEHMSELEVAVDSARKDWFTHLERSFSEILKTTPVPPILYIVADDDMVSFFESFLQKNGFNNYTLSGRVFQVCPVKKDIFSSHTSYTSAAYKDLFVDIEVLYLGLISSTHTITTNRYVIE